MHRICTSLAANDFEVLLVGRKLNASLQVKQQPFQQKRLSCFFNNGFLFYAEYNFRLFFFLLFISVDTYCAIDLDTILPCYFASVFRKRNRVYDAHELFTEQKEIVTRPAIHKFWLMIERFAVPKFPNGYTVNQFIADELMRRYNVNYSVVRNLPLLYKLPVAQTSPEQFIIYQGAVNEGRSFETLIPAMQHVNATLKIFGKGNFFEQAQELVNRYSLQHKVQFMGYVMPDDLKKITPAASIAVTLFEQTGLNQYYSLSNRFFDYIMALVPQVCVNYPEYKAVNDEFDIAVMVEDTRVETIAAALNKLLINKELREHLHLNCVKAIQVLNWQCEEKKLIKFYKSL